MRKKIFFEMGTLSPSPWDFSAFEADRINQRETFPRYGFGVRARGSDPCPACPHSAQRSGRIPALPYPLSEQFHFTSPHVGSAGLGQGIAVALGRIEQGAGFEHRHQHRQIAVCQAAQCPAVTMPPPTEFGIVLLGPGGVLHAGP